MTGSALRLKANLYNSYSMNLETCFQEQMQFALNKKLEHCTITVCMHSPNQMTIQAAWLYIYLYMYYYIRSASKRKSNFFRINTDVLAYLI